MELELRKRIAFAMIMAFCTGSVVTFVGLYANLGFTEGFFRVWLRTFVIAYLVVVPFILIIGPPVQKIVDRLFKNCEIK